MREVALGTPPPQQHTAWQRWVMAALTEIERASYIDNTDSNSSVLTVSSVSALRLLTRATYDGDTVWLASYYERSAYDDATLKGGGPLVLDRSDTSTADDGVIVFVDADGGRWKRDHQGTIWLGQAGGYLDGVNDDLAAFNACLALLNVNGGDVEAMRIEPRVIYTSATPNACYRREGAVRGAGVGATVWKMQSTSGTFIRIGNLNGSTLTKATQWTIEGFSGFYVDNPEDGIGDAVSPSDTTNAAIDARAASYCRVQDIVIQSAVHGLRVGYDNADGEVNQTVFENLQFPSCGVSYNGGTGLDILSSTGCQYIACLWSGYGRSIQNSRPFRMKAAPAAPGIDGNSFTGCIWNYNDADNDYNFEFDATYPAIQNARFIGNTMDGGAVSSMLFKIGSGATSAFCTIHNMSFVGNRITASTGHPGGGGSAVTVEHDFGAPIHRIAFSGNVFGIGLTRPYFTQARGVGVTSRYSGFTFTGNEIGVNLGVLVKAATTGNITLSGLQTIDGYSGSADDLILVWNQTAPAENGIYNMKSGTWTRYAGFNDWDKEVVGAIGVITGGSTYANTIYLNTNSLGGTLGTTAMTFTTTTVDHNFIELDANNFTFVGNQVGYWSAQNDAPDIDGFPFIDYLVSFGASNIRKVLIANNNFPVGFADFAIADTRELTASLLDEGPIIKDNSGIGNSPTRMLLTSNTTVTTIGTMEIPQSKLVSIRGYVVGTRSGTDEWCSFSFNTRVANAAGTAVIKSGGTPTPDFKDAAGTDVTLTVSGANFNIRVQGTANTYRWMLYIEDISISYYIAA